MPMLSHKINVQMTRETEDKGPVDLPADVEVDGDVWIYISKEDILAALEKD